MNTAEKKQLSQEAGLQMKALKKISRWKTNALAVSAVGVALAYAGFAGEKVGLFFGIPGVILILLGASGAVVFHLGLKNGRRNVEKILNLLDKEESYEI